MAGSSEDHYRGEAGRKYQQEKRAVPAAATPWVARLRAEKLQPHVLPEDVVVEFGVGLGWNLAQLKCARRIGTDLDDHLPAEIKKDGVEFLPANVANLSLADEVADVVVCHHVLEHVENPPAMLKEARRILKPGGNLLLYVPYEKEARYRHYDPDERNHHLYAWNPQTLGNLAAGQGFEVINCWIDEFGYDRFAAKLALRLRLGESGFRAIRRAVHLLRPGQEVRLTGRKK